MGAATGTSGVAASATAMHHIGMSVASIDDALGFWEPFLGVSARWRTTLDRPYLGAILGIGRRRVTLEFSVDKFLRYRRVHRPRRSLPNKVARVQRLNASHKTPRRA